mmetsp:Transcript_30985/g.65347  ORF Transcript_30985/g.65347 Transcript_30985/m.65347 type:complete len:276 (-) Transcript_30985:96-923(-)
MLSPTQYSRFKPAFAAALSNVAPDRRYNLTVNLTPPTEFAGPIFPAALTAPAAAASRNARSGTHNGILNLMPLMSTRPPLPTGEAGVEPTAVGRGNHSVRAKHTSLTKSFKPILAFVFPKPNAIRMAAFTASPFSLATKCKEAHIQSGFFPPSARMAMVVTLRSNVAWAFFSPDRKKLSPPPPPLLPGARFTLAILTLLFASVSYEVPNVELYPTSSNSCMAVLPLSSFKERESILPKSAFPPSLLLPVTFLLAHFKTVSTPPLTTQLSLAPTIK